VTDTSRAVIGLALVASLPSYLPWVRHARITRCAFVAISGAWVVYPLRDHWKVWALVLCLAVAQTVDWPAGVAKTRDRLPRTIPGPVFVAASTPFLAAFLLDQHGAWSAFIRALESDRAVAITLGLLSTVFPLGALIGALTRPWAKEVERHLTHEDLPRGLAGAGTYIGWLERSAIFCAVVLGHPGAVAAIFAAKSLARFPSFTREAFAEYYLIGTLLSVFSATAAGVGIRLALGLSAT